MKERKQYTKDQMYAIIRELEASGLTQEVFLKKRDISKSTFGYWRKKYLQDHLPKQAPSSRLIPVQIEPETNPLTESSNLEIIYPNGVRIILSGQVDAKQVRKLIL